MSLACRRTIGVETQICRHAVPWRLHINAVSPRHGAVARAAGQVGVIFTRSPSTFCCLAVHMNYVGLDRSQESGSETWVAENQDKLRAAPLLTGGLGVAGVVLNRAFSGVCFVLLSLCISLHFFLQQVTKNAVICTAGCGFGCELRRVTNRCNYHCSLCSSHAHRATVARIEACDERTGDTSDSCRNIHCLTSRMSEHEVRRDAFLTSHFDAGGIGRKEGGVSAQLPAQKGTGRA